MEETSEPLARKREEWQWQWHQQYLVLLYCIISHSAAENELVVAARCGIAHVQRGLITKPNAFLSVRAPSIGTETTA